MPCTHVSLSQSVIQIICAGKIGSIGRFLGVATANVEYPDIVRNMHMEYLESGASVITTNSYSCIPATLCKKGLHSSSEIEKKIAENDMWEIVCSYIKAAGRRATEAREEYVNHYSVDRAIRIAGCIPPLNASYRFDLVGSEEDMVASYHKIVSEIQSFSDLLLCETLSSVKETRAAVQAAASSGLPLWVSWTLHEDNSGNLRSSESIAEAVAALQGVSRLEACLLNCCSCQSITAALPQVRVALVEMGRPDVRIGAYANGFVTVNLSGICDQIDVEDTHIKKSYGGDDNCLSSSDSTPIRIDINAPSLQDDRIATSGEATGNKMDVNLNPHPRTASRKKSFASTKTITATAASASSSYAGEYLQQLTPRQYLEQARGWVQQGATVVGGCCGIFPEHISALQQLNLNHLDVVRNVEEEQSN